MEFAMDIDNDDIKLAQLLAKEYQNNKEKIFVSSLGVSAFIKYLSDCNIQIDKHTSLYRNQKIYQITDIADVNIQGTIIDVRTFVNSDALYIPKLHFDNNLIPQYYIYAKYEETKQEIIFKGFLKSNDIDKTKTIQNYYIVNENSLSPMENLLEELYNLPLKDVEYDNNSIQSTYGAFIDNDLDKSTEIEIIKLLYSSSDYAKDFLEFTQFEFLANNISQFDNLLELQDNLEEISDINNTFIDNAIDFSTDITTAESLNTLDQMEQPFEYALDMLDDILPNSNANKIQEQYEENADDTDNTFEKILEEDKNPDFEENLESDILEGTSENETDKNSDFEEFTDNNEIEELEDLNDLNEIQEDENLIENQEESFENNNEELEELDNLEGLTDNLEDLQEDENLSDNIEELSEEDNLEDFILNDDNNVSTIEEDNNFELSDNTNNEIFENLENIEEISENDIQEQQYLINDDDFEDEESKKDTQNNDTNNEDLEELSLLDIDDEEENQDITSDNNEVISETNDELDIFLENNNENSDTNDEDLDLLQSDEIFNEQEKENSSEPEIVENNEEENVSVEELDNLLSELSTNNIQEENSTPVINNENHIELQTLFEKENKEVPLEGEQLSSTEYSMYVEEPKQKKSKFIVPLVSLCVFGTLMGTAGYLKFAHKNVQETPDTVIDLKVKSIDDFDDETFLEKTTDTMLNDKENIAGNPEETLEANPDGIQPKDINQSMTDIFDETIYPVTISKIAWEVPENYITSKSFKKYLQVTGIQLQRELQQNLANVTEVSKTGKIKISFTINENNTIKGINILETSGSSEIDAITKKSVQNTAQYIKIPFIPSNEEFVTLTMVINF